MGIADTVAPTSEQLDAIELTEPRTFTITRVDFKENAEQPIIVHLAEFPRPWKPGKNMRRVLMGVWGKDEQAYVGRRLTLFNNPKVKWAGKEVGGSRISHMSHIDKPVNVQVIASQGQYGTYRVQPLTPDVELAALRAEWSSADADRQAAIKARVAELQSSPAADAPPPPGRAKDEVAPDASSPASEFAGEVDPPEVNFDDKAGA